MLSRRLRTHDMMRRFLREDPFEHFFTRNHSRMLDHFFHQEREFEDFERQIVHQSPESGEPTSSEGMSNDLAKTEHSGNGNENSGNSSYQFYTRRSHMVRGEDGKIVSKEVAAYKDSSGANAKRSRRTIGEEARESFEGNDLGVKKLKNGHIFASQEKQIGDVDSTKLQAQEQAQEQAQKQAQEQAQEETQEPEQAHGRAHMEEKTEERKSEESSQEIDVFEKEWAKTKEVFEDSPFFLRTRRRSLLSLL